MRGKSVLSRQGGLSPVSPKRWVLYTIPLATRKWANLEKEQTLSSIASNEPMEADFTKFVSRERIKQLDADTFHVLDISRHKDTVVQERRSGNLHVDWRLGSPARRHATDDASP